MSGDSRSLSADEQYLTPEEVVARYRDELTLGTLRNWRAMRVGPDFIKIGKAVLYPQASLDAWDKQNLVSCNTQKRREERVDD